MSADSTNSRFSKQSRSQCVIFRRRNDVNCLSWVKRCVAFQPPDCRLSALAPIATIWRPRPFVRKVPKGDIALTVR